MKKILRILALLMVFGLLFSACATPAAEEVPAEEVAPVEEAEEVVEEKLVVGFSLLTRTHTFYMLMEEALDDEAVKQGVEIVAVDANMDNATQLNQVQDFITQGVDAIILTPVDSAGIEAAIKLANDAEIPVFTMDTAATGDGVVVSHVATDNYAGGVLDGEYAVEVLDGKGEVAIIGCAGIESITLRTQGFQDAVKDYPDIEIVASTDCKCDGAIACDQTADLLVAYPDLALVFGTGDPFGLGAMTAITAANREVYVVSLDGLPEGIAEVKKGGLFLCTVAQDPDLIARTTLQNIVKYLGGEEIDPLILISPYVIDIKNAP
ncbi:MAG TPA: substrate-binding domain-containing protein [Anaerolineae bacterium]|nr:substrate-binding domain-containing protein [Anaerolineae bacterium]